MKPTQLDEEDIFHAARRIEGPESRGAYLDGACGPDRGLRDRVEALLRAYDEERSFLEAPAVDSPSAETAAVPPQPIEEAGQVIGPYKLLEQIGEGGMGIVFMAEQTRPVRRRVALKVIKPGMDSKQVIARFEAERQALALMDHPNIARVLDAGATDSGRPYFVMELVKGVPITDYCDAARLPITERLGLFEQVCRAVQHAHQKGVIHRDLKPSNVLVTIVDGAPVPKVIDFGIAKATGGSLTERTLFTGFAQLVGTPLYMSPEQAELSGVDVDTRSDIYSLGVLLYELLTGTTPFDQETLRRAALDEIRRIIREQEPPTPSHRLSSLGETLTDLSSRRGSDRRRLEKAVRGELDWIVMKALEKDRNRRYESASGLAADVRRYLEDEPVQACPPSAWYRLSKAARRHSGALATMALVAAALVLGTAVSTWQAVRATRSQRVAAAARDAEGRARLGAEAAEKAARTEADKAQAVNDFLSKDLLTQAEPENNPVEDKVTLLEVVDRAAEKVEERFRDRPEVESALRRTLAGTYHSLGAFEKAERQAEAALDLHRRLHGPEAAETFLALGKLAHMRDHLGRSREVLETLRRAAEGLRRTLGPDHPDTLESLNDLVLAYQHAGLAAEAIKLGEETVKLKEASLGPNHTDTLVGRNNLANAYVGAGRTAEGIEMLQAVVKARESGLGPDHPRTLASLCNLAHAFLVNGRTDQAVALYERALKHHTSKLGPDHPSTLANRSGLAAAYLDAGRPADAARMFEDTLKLSTTKLGPDHPETLIIRNNLGETYRRSGRTAEAAVLHGETLALMTAKLGPDNPCTLTCRNNLAVAYEANGRRAEAVRLYESGLKLMEAKLGPDHPNTLTGRNNLASAYESMNRWADAEALRRDTLARRRKAETSESPRLSVDVFRLGVNLLKQSKWAEAEPLLRESLAIIDKAPPDDWSRFNIMTQLGEALLRQGKYAEAEPLIVGGYEGLKAREATLPPAAKPRLPEASRRVVRLYEAWDEPEKAAVWKARLGLADLPADVFARP